VATTATAAVAAIPATADDGVSSGRRGQDAVRSGRSTATYDTVATASVAAHRTPNSAAPPRPVRSASIHWNSGQCHR
jgi:hypothetical protein